MFRFYIPLQRNLTSLSGEKTELIIRKMAQQEVMMSCVGLNLCVDH